VDAEFMPFVQHERGIHAKSPGTGGASVTEVRLCSGATHRDHKPSGIAAKPGSTAETRQLNSVKRILELVT
jgi:hypothetical protein